jgi:hypothetical protein
MDPFFHLITESLKKVCNEKSIEQTDRIALNTFYEKDTQRLFSLVEK